MDDATWKPERNGNGFWLEADDTYIECLTTGDGGYQCFVDVGPKGSETKAEVFASSESEAKEVSVVVAKAIKSYRDSHSTRKSGLN